MKACPIGQSKRWTSYAYVALSISCTYPRRGAAIAGIYAYYEPLSADPELLDLIESVFDPTPKERACLSSCPAALNYPHCCRITACPILVRRSALGLDVLRTAEDM